MHITLKNAELLKHSKLIITLRFLTLCASVGNKKGSVLLMHGVTMKLVISFVFRCNSILRYVDTIPQSVILTQRRTSAILFRRHTTGFET